MLGRPKSSLLSRLPPELAARVVKARSVIYRSDSASTALSKVYRKVKSRPDV